MNLVFQLLPGAIAETLYMVFFSSLFAFLVGLPVGIILFLTRPGGLAPQGLVYRVLDFIVNIMRSIPYIILMILLIPVTRVLIGTAIGSTAMIFSLASSAAPFFARLVESALMEVDQGLLEAAQAMGSTTKQIVFKVLLPEAFPSLILAMTTTIINLIGYTAMAGTLGGGGLGALAVRYGLYRYVVEMLFTMVIAIVVLVQLVQFAGSRLAAAINKK